METVCSRPAYAKVNLHLAIGLPSLDGYHPIQSLFALVDLSDTITVRWEESREMVVEVEGLEAYCKPQEDTLSKAARLWHAAGGKPLCLQILCEKRIPVKAGLGGGSSDAATVLHMLQQIDERHALSEQELHTVALQVGSDVPFFLSGSRLALVTGRGENVTPLVGRSIPILLVMPNFFDVSTSSAYRSLDVDRKDIGEVVFPPLRNLLHVYKKSSQNWKGLLYNDFQPCSSNHDFYMNLDSLCKDSGGFSSMSGSGACWFYVNEDVSRVHDVYNDVLAAFGPRVRCWMTHLMD